MKKLLFLIALILILPLSSDAATFGYTTAGASSVQSTTDAVYGSVYQIPASGTATSMSWYIVTSGFDDGPSKLAIYQFESGGNDTHAYVAETGVFASLTPDSWNTQNLTTSPSLTSGTNYLLVHYGEEYSFAYDTSATTKIISWSMSYPGAWPDPLVATESGTTFRNYSIYATYTASGGGGGSEPSYQQDIFWFD